MIKKYLIKLFSIALCISCIYTNSANIVKAEDNVDDTDTVTVTYGMQWVDKDGNPLPATRSTFSGSCGSATLTASRSLVSVVIRPSGGWIAWDFTGDVDDTLGDNHHMYLYSTGSLVLSDSYELYQRGSRFLTLTGVARDVSLASCAVVPNATIHHTY
jgi:hypothetical protein